MLWLALHLPQLPLEALGHHGNSDASVAVTENQVVICCNQSARGSGVQHGQRPTEARTLAPNLQLLERQRQTEARTLRHLADWAYQFSSHVSPRTPDGLLLEIGASTRLFGGLEPLIQHLVTALDALGHAHQYGIAPTPTAAWLFALAGEAAPVDDPATLAGRLQHLPCRVLELSPRQQQALAGLGVHSLGDCLRLPRRDLARRFGRGLLLQLEHALGERPEPRPAHRPPRRFHRHLDLPAEAHDTVSLGFALQRLLRELAGLLRGLEGGVQHLGLELHHLHRDASRMDIGLLRPSRDPEHLFSVCQHRLEREQLAAPVIALCLRADRIQSLPPRDTSLLVEPDQPEHDQQQLSERLGARLGEHAVTGLASAADHRPEHAWRQDTSAAEEQLPPVGERPLWLLPTPLPLDSPQGHPRWHGPLTLECGPERIEGGWWDGADISRDYYQARNPRGSRMWIFRERREQRWFLHGFFG